VRLNSDYKGFVSAFRVTPLLLYLFYIISICGLLIRPCSGTKF